MEIYVVKSGDTISAISRKYGISEQTIIEENGLEYPNNLLVGQSLYISSNNNVKLNAIQVNGYAYPYIKEDVLEKTLKYLTYVTFFTYGFTSEGELIPIDDDVVINIAKNGGVQPIMLISTLTVNGGFSNELAHQVLNDYDSQTILIENILANLKNKGFYGLDVDFEYILPEDKDAYVSFIERLKGVLSENNYILIVALAPKTSSEQKGLLYEAHDYYRLAQAADYVLIMTYEWGYTYGPPMAVAPIDKVREVLDYAVTQIEPDKIFMGVPNYGYDWPTPYIRGETKASSISNVNAINLAVKYNVEIKFDDIAKSPYFEYTDEEGKAHIVWFEDARSIEAKMYLVYEYGFKGISFWNIMNFFPQGYNVINGLFNIEKI